MTKRLTAEFIGTLWLVLGGCGSAGSWRSSGGVVYRGVGGDEPAPIAVTGHQ